ncbi:DUF4184 family protein [Metabacillus fastidiosus]|uniref:DUF4184 family protein n=1 Tax=Metabacillus fastidiosus TaxID=1458 RepID=UPI002DBCB628|nr:DUF4184 family protein [Metabacillus fastidiosus]MEC2077011.1 DUF4184 family protein [Metabacillus fastidiosus]
MPLTFAHPAAVLPFQRKNKYVHFPAMVFGSMAPDYEYFLSGQPVGNFGHTLTGFLFLNLPLVIAVYFIYKCFIRQTVLYYLPFTLQGFYMEKQAVSNIWKIIVFCYSALFGMLTHVVWDSFTHIDGFIVMKFLVFSHIFHLYGFTIPLYKFLQHGSTLFGIIVLAIYIFYKNRIQENEVGSGVSGKQKIIFWCILFFLALIFLILWYLIDYIPATNYGIAIVRIIDSVLVSLLVVSLLFKEKKRNISINSLNTKNDL